jgi:hypothetical protein
MSRWLGAAFGDRELAGRVARIEATVDDFSTAAAVDDARRAMLADLRRNGPAFAPRDRARRGAT